MRAFAPVHFHLSREGHVSNAKLLAAIRTRPESTQIKLLQLLLDGMTEPPADLVAELRKLQPAGTDERPAKTKAETDAEVVAALRMLGMPFGAAGFTFFSTP